MLLRGNNLQSEIRGGNLVNRDEIIVGIVIFLFGLITTVLSLKMPIGTFRMAGTGMFPLISRNTPHDFIRGLRFKNFLSGKRKTDKKRSLHRIFGVSKTIDPFPGNNGSRHSLFQQIGISPLRAPFDVGTFESSWSEKVDTHSAFIIYDGSRLLFFIRPMAEDPFAQGVDWNLKNKVEVRGWRTKAIVRC